MLCVRAYSFVIPFHFVVSRKNTMRLANKIVKSERKFSVFILFIRDPFNVEDFRQVIDWLRIFDDASM